MKRIGLIWSNFKDIAITKKSLMLQFVLAPVGYLVFADDEGIRYETKLATGSDDCVDFETNYKSTANQTMQQRSLDGVTKQANTLYQVEDSFYTKGAKVNIAASSTGKVEFQFAYDIKMIGIITQWKESDIGDYLECSVGFYDGEVWIEVNKYGETLYVVNGNSMDISTNDYASIPAGLVIRVEYTNVSESNAKDFICWLKCYR